MSNKKRKVKAKNVSKHEDTQMEKVIGAGKNFLINVLKEIEPSAKQFLTNISKKAFTTAESKINKFMMEEESNDGKK